MKTLATTSPVRTLHLKRIPLWLGRMAAAGLLLGASAWCAELPAVANNAPNKELSPLKQLSELSVRPAGEHSVRLTFRSMSQGPGEELPASAALIDQPWPEPVLRLKVGESAPQTSVGQLRVRVRNNPFRVEVADAAGRLVQGLAFDLATGQMMFSCGEGPVLGLGEGAKQFDRRGVLYPMKSGWGTFERPKYGSCNAVPLLIGTKGWALFVLSPWGQFDLKGERGVFLPSPNAKGGLDVVVFDAHQPEVLMQELARLTGQPVMPPKWALGYMQSHRTLEDSKQMLEIADTFRSKKLPCDAVIYLGTGFCPQGWNLGHDSFEFNPKVFVVDPAEVLNEFHGRHFEVVLHVVPPEVQLHGEIPPRAGETLDPAHIANYWKRHEAALKAGADGWWPDDGDWMEVPARLARHRMYYQGSLADRPNQRPWALHRNGYLGMGRYGAWLWSGDIDSRWETLAAQVAVGVNSSLSVSPYWGSDTGGFYPTKELDGELYTRWFQFAAFCPSFRAHGRTWHLRLPWGWNTGQTGPLENKCEPPAADLHNGAVEPICREYLNLRYRLLPYTYTLAREAYDTGLPLMRALWLHYPNEPRAVGQGSEYLWGRDLLVAPVVEKGANQREVYLPRGDWYDWWSGQRLAGGCSIRRDVDLRTMPLYVRAGAIVPLDPVRQYVDEPVNEPTTLQVYAGADGRFTLYEDDGKTLGYQRGQSVWTAMTWNDAARRLVLEPGSTNAGNAPSKRSFKIRLMPAGSEKTVEYTGKRLEISW